MGNRRDFEYFNHYECHKGFYNDDDMEKALTEISYTDYFEFPKIKEFPLMNAIFLLKGACNCFALSLKKEFGYNTYVIEEYNGSGFHVFCQVYRDNRWYFVDARGVTTSFSDFLSDLGMFIHDEFTIRPVTRDDIERWENECFCYREGYQFAVKIIRDYKECYSL